MIRRLLKDSAAILLGNLAYAASQWALLAFYAHDGGLEVAGRYALALALTTPVFLIGYLGNRILLVTDVHNEWKVSHLLTLRACLMLICLTLCVIYVLIVGWDARLVLCVATMKAIEGLGDLTYGAMHRAGRAYRQGVSLMLKCTTAATGFAISRHFYSDETAGFIGAALAWSLVVAFYDLRAPTEAAQLSFARLDKHLFAAAQKVALASTTIVASSLLVALITNAPRYAIANVLDDKALGAFSAMTAFIVAANVAVSALGQAIVPRMSRLLANRDRTRFTAIAVLGLCLVGIGGTILVTMAALWGKSILTIFFGSEAAVYYPIFWLVMLLSLPVCAAQFISYVNMGTRSFRSTLAVNILTLVVVTIICQPMIQTYGLVGAGAAIGIAGSIQTAGFIVSALAAWRRAPQLSPNVEGAVS